MFNLFYKVIKETQMVAIKYVDDNKIIEKSFELKGTFDESKIEELEGFLGSDINDIVKLSFYTLFTKSNGKKEIQVEGPRKNYFIGDRISLTQYQDMMSTRNPYDQLIGLDDYIVSAVIHPNTKIVSPLYTGDIIFDTKEKTKAK